MQFVEKSSNPVTDITIPEGEVIKIEEADTGRVLWEKKLKVNISIEKITAPTFSFPNLPQVTQSNWCIPVERENDIIFFTRSGSQTATEEDTETGRFFTYNPQNNNRSRVQKHFMGVVQGAAIDPISQTCMVIGYTNVMRLPEKYNGLIDINWSTLNGDFGGAADYVSKSQNFLYKSDIEWIPQINKFFIVETLFDYYDDNENKYGFNTYLVNSKGECTNASSHLHLSNCILDSRINCKWIGYAENLNKFFILFGKNIFLSTDGLSFTSYPLPIEEANYNFVWLSDKKIFLLLGRSTSGVKLFTSKNGRTWNEYMLPSSIPYSSSAVWNPSKGMLFLFSSEYTYVTNNFTQWTAIKNNINIPLTDVHSKCIWSTLANAFILTVVNSAYFYKISIRE